MILRIHKVHKDHKVTWTKRMDKGLLKYDVRGNLYKGSGVLVFPLIIKIITPLFPTVSPGQEKRERLPFFLLSY